MRVGMPSERNGTGLNRDRDTQRRYLTRKFEFSDHQEQTVVDGSWNIKIRVRE